MKFASYNYYNGWIILRGLRKMKYLHYINSFKRNFNKRDPILIYGTGKIASELISEISDYNVMGVLDKQKKEGFFGNYPLIDIDCLSNYKNSKVVIVAAERNLETIYKRISVICKKSNVSIYDIYGRDLSILFSSVIRNDTYFSKTWSELDRKVSECDVISFDIFDTLLKRKTLYPTDIFEIIQQRIICSSSAEARHICSIWKCNEGGFVKRRLDVLNRNMNCPSIYEIYSEIDDTELLTTDDKKWLIDLEIKVEKDYIIPRMSMRDYFKKIVSSKRVVLISNMHLSENILSEILRENGFEGYEKIFVSCEYKCSKSQGLFRMAFEELDVNPNSVLHIGDSYIQDIVSAQDQGIGNTFHILSELELLKKSSFSEIVELELNALERLVLGLFINEVFDDPFVLAGTQGRITIDSFDKFVSLFVSPLIWGYSIWCFHQIARNKNSLVLFSSRDGFIVKKIYDLLFDFLYPNERNNGIYFYTSRMAILKSVVNDRDSLEEVVSIGYDGNIGSFFEQRFELHIDNEIGKLDYSESSCREVLDMYGDEIICQCLHCGKSHLKYINELNIRNREMLYLVDQCGYGRVQYGLEQLINSNNVMGLYLKKYNHMPLSSQNYLSYFPDADEGIADSLPNYSIILEEIFSSDEPSVKGFDNRGNILFQKEVRSEEQIDRLRNAHEIIRKKYLEILENDRWLFETLELDWKFVDCLWGFVTDKYINLHIPTVYVEDIFGTAKGTVNSIEND